VAVRDRGSEQRRRYDPHLFLHLPTPSIQLTRQAVSYVSRRRMDAVDFDPDEVDEEGLPLVYNEDRINAFWSARLGELAGRWATFARISAPWLTRLATAVVRGTLERDRAALARDAVDNLEKLGPTYVKLGQILSIRYAWCQRGSKREGERRKRGKEEGGGRTSLSTACARRTEFLSRPQKFESRSRPLSTPNHAQTTHRYSPDVLPPDVMDELARLQDNIKSFSTVEARAIIEADMGQPIDVLFSEFSPAPIAAASLAQVRSIVLWLFHGTRNKHDASGYPAPHFGEAPFSPLCTQTSFPHPQVYRARLRSTGEEVAVKVQRPGALSTISKVSIKRAPSPRATFLL
jgi:ABC1 atypical kinase-like domain